MKNYSFCSINILVWLFMLSLHYLAIVFCVLENLITVINDNLWLAFLSMFCLIPWYVAIRWRCWNSPDTKAVLTSYCSRIKQTNVLLLNILDFQGNAERDEIAIHTGFGGAYSSSLHYVNNLHSKFVLIFIIFIFDLVILVEYEFYINVPFHFSQGLREIQGLSDAAHWVGKKNYFKIHMCICISVIHYHNFCPLNFWY